LSFKKWSNNFEIIFNNSCSKNDDDYKENYGKKDNDDNFIINLIIISNF